DPHAVDVLWFRMAPQTGNWSLLVPALLLLVAAGLVVQSWRLLSRERVQSGDVDMRPRPAITATARWAIVAALLAGVLLGEAQWFARRHSITYDETIYLNLSLQSLREGRLDPEFMRLGVAPLPMLLTYAFPLRSRVAEPRPSVQAGRMTDARLIRAPRLLN